MVEMKCPLSISLFGAASDWKGALEYSEVALRGANVRGKLAVHSEIWLWSKYELVVALPDRLIWVMGGPSCSALNQRIVEGFIKERPWQRSLRDVRRRTKEENREKNPLSRPPPFPSCLEDRKCQAAATSSYRFIDIDVALPVNRRESILKVTR